MGLALAGLAFALLPRVADSPRADLLSPTDDAAGDRSDAHAGLAVTPAEAVPGPGGGPAPPRPVTVTYESGLLEIRTHAAPLHEVLAAITSSVGITFVGADDAREPVSIEAGPAPVLQVLSVLLAGTHYGYAFLHGSSHSRGVRPIRVILLRQKGTLQQRAADKLVEHRPPVRVAPDQIVPASGDEPGVRQQQVLDHLLEACKQQGCDTS
jgi:hypothetical protein